MKNSLTEQAVKGVVFVGGAFLSALFYRLIDKAVEKTFETVTTLMEDDEQHRDYANEVVENLK
jgi:hypothetical protein